jgi:aminoglycoside phosphotransferase (APT) family kinase protein
MNPTSLEQQILRYLEASGGGRLVRSWSLDGGISTSMTAFEVELPNGRRRKLIARRPGSYRLRQNPDAAAAEFRVLRTLWEAGLPVPEALSLEPGADETPEPCLILEYVEGRVELDPEDAEGYLRRYAGQLARIHQLDLSKADLGFLEVQTRGYRKRREVSNDSLRETEIRDALDRAGPPPRSNPPVLCHGDFWPGNVLWREGEIAAVIDWEECLIGEPLADLAICRLDLWWILGEAAAAYFTDRYQSRMSLDLGGLPYWDLCASLRPIAGIEEWAAAYPPLGRADVTAETMRRDHQAFVDQALSRLKYEPASKGSWLGG